MIRMRKGDFKSLLYTARPNRDKKVFMSMLRDAGYIDFNGNYVYIKKEIPFMDIHNNRVSLSLCEDKR